MTRTLFTSLAAAVAASSSAVAQTTNIASSLLEYTNVQGTNGWNYGYYNRTTDPGGVYSGTEFQNMPVSGGGYALGGNPPWTSIANNLTGHPNGTDNGAEHWIARRYTVGAGEGGAAFDINWLLRKGNTACGDGVTGYIFHNGTQIDSLAIAGNAGTGSLRRASIPLVNVGDTIDLMVSPTSNSDGCDSTDFFMDINRRNTYSGITTTLFADSVADFGNNTNGWTYGYYNTTLNGPPGPGEFLPFGSGAWNGSMWDLNPAASGPWSEISATGGHPNGTNSTPGEEHWVTRRYTIGAGEDGDIKVDWDLAKGNTNGGNGTSVHILRNGIEVASTGVQGFDGLGFSGSLAIADTQVGDTIDIALAPQGMDAQLFGSGDNSDGADGSLFSMRIYSVPEPAAAGLLALAVGVLNLRRRSRRS